MSRDKRQLTLHIAAVHEKKKPFECELCNRRFVTRAQSVRHRLEKHGNVRPHECQLCDKKFKRNGTLVAHMKNIHSKAD